MWPMLFDGTQWHLVDGWERDFRADDNRLESWSEVRVIQPFDTA